MSSVAFTYEQFFMECPLYQYARKMWKIHFGNYPRISQGTVNQMSRILGANGNHNKTNEDIWYAINMMQPRYGITEFLLAKDFIT